MIQDGMLTDLAGALILTLLASILGLAVWFAAGFYQNYSAECRAAGGYTITTNRGSRLVCVDNSSVIVIDVN